MLVGRPLLLLQHDLRYSCPRRSTNNRSLLFIVERRRYSRIIPVSWRVAPAGFVSTFSSSSQGAAILLEKYRAKVKAKEFHEDEHQVVSLKALDRLYHELSLTKPPTTPVAQPLESSSISTAPTATNNSWSYQSTAVASSGSSWSSWFGGGGGQGRPESAASSLFSFSQQPRQSQHHSSPRGVYLHGGVGCGKTALMNLFYDTLIKDTKHPWSKQGQKIHFHKFMLNVHQEMHEARYAQQQKLQDNNSDNNSRMTPLQRSSTNGANGGGGDVILPYVIAKTAQRGRLICLDEFQVTDVADALILQRLFSGLWRDYGCVVVATSNRPPSELYLHGLQRDRFVPFIHLLQNQICHVVSLDASETDYRLVQKMQDSSYSTSTNSSIDLQKVFFLAKSRKLPEYKEFDALFYRLVKQSAVAPTELETTLRSASGENESSTTPTTTTTRMTTSGRKVKIPQASLSAGICRMTFEDVCQKAMGAADYLVIGQYFHTVFVENIPGHLTLNEMNWIRRFIIFIDAMYESQVKLILQTKTPISEIFTPATASSPPKQQPQQPEPVVVSSRKDKAASHYDEVFAFDRTLSRLQEMSSQTYLQKRWKGGRSRQSGKEAGASSVVSVEPSLGDSMSTKRGL